MFLGLAATGAAKIRAPTATTPAIFANMYLIGLTLGRGSLG
jgi:hypothetical protein